MYATSCDNVDSPRAVNPSATSWTVGPKKSRMQLDASVMTGSCGIDDKGDVETNFANGLLFPAMMVVVVVANRVLAIASTVATNKESMDFYDKKQKTTRDFYGFPMIGF